MELMRALEATLVTDNLDDLFENFLPHLFQIANIRVAEIRLFNDQENLIPVAAAKWVGPEGNRHLKIWSESWVLESPISRTSRQTLARPVQPVFSIPLLHADGMLGFLNIQLDQLEIISREQLNQLYVLGAQMAAKMREIRLNREIADLKAELQSMSQINKEIRQQSTSLSKELYAISAISTKINQSLEFDKSLGKSIATTLKVFKASAILVYIRNDAQSELELVATEFEPEYPDKSLPPAYLGLIERQFLPEILKSGKPLVKDQIPKQMPSDMAWGQSNLPQYVIGSPLTAKETAVGAMVLLYATARSPGFATLRLLSGMANIMALAIENMQLYRQSVQKKSEAAFLFHSIVKFNETLDLKAVLKSVSEKGAEFCGVHTRVYVLSQMRVPFILSYYEARGNSHKLKSVSAKSFSSPELKQLYYLLLTRLKKRSAFIRKIGYSKLIPGEMKKLLREKKVNSLIAVPLHVGKHKFGLLLMVRGPEAAPFNSNEHSFAEALGSAASFAIENARSYTASKEMSDFLEKKITEKNSQIDHIQAKQQARVENRREILFQVNKNNRFVYVNKAMEVFSGLPRETLCHKDFRAVDVVAEEDKKRVDKIFVKVLRNQASIVRDIEYRHVNRSGEDCIMSLTIYPEIGRDGRIVGVEGVGRNITEQKRLEAELKKAKEMAMLGEFSSAMAHQMRNPLGNILMATKRLQKELNQNLYHAGNGDDDRTTPEHPPFGDSDTMAEILKNLSGGVYNLNQVVTELLEYTKTLKPRRSFQKIDIILEETLQTFKNIIQQNNITVACHFDRQIPPMLLDAVLIGQALQNIIHNAIQAMQKGGPLELFTAACKDRPGYIMVTIRDAGKGIGQNELDKIFHPFYTTKAQGTGLGLSLAHRIIEAHGGSIWACATPCAHLAEMATNTPNGIRSNGSIGATIHILLPIEQRIPGIDGLRENA